VLFVGFKTAQFVEAGLCSAETMLRGVDNSTEVGVGVGSGDVEVGSWNRRSSVNRDFCVNEAGSSSCVVETFGSEVCIIIEFWAMTMLTPWYVEPINHGTGLQMTLASLQAVMAEVGRAKNRYDKRSSFTVKIRTKE